MNRLLVLIAAIIIVACSARNENSLKSGKWRGEFEIAGEKIPILFEVAADSAGSAKVYFINDKERALYKAVHQGNDSILISLDDFDSKLIVFSSGSTLNGFYRRDNSKGKGIPFHADFNKTNRFEPSSKTPSANLSGTWDVEISSEGKPTNKTVGLFDQKDGKLTGTIMTITGDYRFFEGQLDGDTFYLSAFSGSSPKLIKGRIVDPSNFEAELINPGGKVKLVGKRNDKAALPDPYSLTYLKNSEEKFDFSFPDPDGKSTSLHDEKYKGKVILVTITGSWCPNCMDEAEFLAPWYKENKGRGVEIISLSFERKDDLAFAKGKIERFKKKYGITYDVLFAGAADKNASQKLPQINAIVSYPTSFLIDRKGNVRKIYTGFTGPATGKYYDQYVEGFKKEVDELLLESI